MKRCRASSEAEPAGPYASAAGVRAVSGFARVISVANLTSRHLQKRFVRIGTAVECVCPLRSEKAARPAGEQLEGQQLPLSHSNSK